MGFQPMSGYPLARSIGQLWRPQPARYVTTYEHRHSSIRIHRSSIHPEKGNQSSSFTFSRSGSSSARARPLLSITEEAATSKGVEPLMAGDATVQMGKQPLFIINQLLLKQQGAAFLVLPKPPAADPFKEQDDDKMILTFIRQRFKAALLICASLDMINITFTSSMSYFCGFIFLCCRIGIIFFMNE